MTEEVALTEGNSREHASSTSRASLQGKFEVDMVRVEVEAGAPPRGARGGREVCSMFYWHCFILDLQTVKYLDSPLENQST